MDIYIQILHTDINALLVVLYGAVKDRSRGARCDGVRGACSTNDTHMQDLHVEIVCTTCMHHLYTQCHTS
eukprot:COSAG03_NODE_344_length_8812_cov_3.890049_8_plen_70_part_00